MPLTDEGEIGLPDTVSTGLNFRLEEVRVSLSLLAVKPCEEEERILLVCNVKGESLKELLECCLTGGSLGPQERSVSRSVILDRCLIGSPPGIQFDSVLREELPGLLGEVLDTCLAEYEGVESRRLVDVELDLILP